MNPMKIEPHNAVGIYQLSKEFPLPLWHWSVEQATRSDGRSSQHIAGAKYGYSGELLAIVSAFHISHEGCEEWSTSWWEPGWSYIDTERMSAKDLVSAVKRLRERVEALKAGGDQ